MSKLIILGIDALEIDLINNLNLVALKQKQYGDIKVPFSSISGYPRSPSVWATFLIGEEVEREFVSVEPSVNRFGELDQETFVEWDGVKALNVPYHNHEIDTLRKIVKLQRKRSNHRNNPDVQLDLLSKMIDAHSTRAEEIVAETIKVRDNPKHKVIFAYIQTLDTLQHYFILRSEIIQHLYRVLDDLVSDLKKQLEDDVLIIVSDHGFKEGTHSYKGYYSCSHPLEEAPTNITDFYKIVKEFLCY